ncbi:MAG TPA: hypothetical protein PLG67_13050 [Bacillota bacterium]|nr:hypothetical protein [Bacillota bacterium]HQE66608.1 hypothetical protein [Bacillota bacterium]HQL37513.1 hypothetical protein [Bacillota bacterium]
MKYEEYIKLLISKLEKNFTIERDIVIFDNKIDIFAKFSNISVRTFITQHDIIDQYNNHEHIYIKGYDNVTEEDIVSFGQFLKRISDECISPDKDHMSTYITGVLIGNHIDENAIRAVKKYNYRKAFCFYLKGWCDVRLIYVGLDNNMIITNRDGKKVKKVYESVL